MEGKETKFLEIRNTNCMARLTKQAWLKTKSPIRKKSGGNLHNIVAKDRK